MSVHMYVHRMISILLLTHVRTQDNLYSSTFIQAACTNKYKQNKEFRERGGERNRIFYSTLHTKKNKKLILRRRGRFSPLEIKTKRG